VRTWPLHPVQPFGRCAADAANGDTIAIEALRRYLLRRGGWSEALKTALTEYPDDHLRQTLFAKLRWDLDQPPSSVLVSRAKAALLRRTRLNFAAPARLTDTLLPRCLNQIETVAQRPADERFLDVHGLELIVEESLAAVRNMSVLAAQVSTARPIGSTAALIQRLEAMRLKDETRGLNDLETARTAMSGGRIRGAIEIIERWIDNEDLSAAVRAKALRLRAEASLVLPDLDGASAFAARATACDGIPDMRLEVLILGARDPKEALARLPNGSGGDPWLRAELLVRAGEPGAARDLLETQAGDDGPERARIRAMAYAASGDVPRAQSVLEPLLGRFADVELRGASAVLHYVAAQARGVTIGLSRWPSPTHSGLVRRLADAADHLRRAADLFGEIAIMLDDPQARADRNVWRLACLANIDGGQGEAERLAGSLLDTARPHPGAVHWALARSLKFDASAVEARLPERAFTSRSWHRNRFPLSLIVGT
jgi:hypothetical protein